MPRPPGHAQLEFSLNTFRPCFLFLLKYLKRIVSCDYQKVVYQANKLFLQAPFACFHFQVFMYFLGCGSGLSVILESER